MQQNNSKYESCVDRDATINHIISECSKLARKEYQTRHDWVGKVIHWEQCKKLKFDQTNKCYMHKLESILEKETHKVLWNSEMQIPAIRPDLVIINKKKKRRTWHTVDVAVSTDHENREKYLHLNRKLSKLRNINVTMIPIIIGVLGTVLRGLKKGLEDLEIEGWIETIQTSALLKSARILRRVLETWGDLLSLGLLWKIIS